MSIDLLNRMQVSNGGNKLTVKLENVKYAEYVGPFDSPNSWPFDGLNVRHLHVVQRWAKRWTLIAKQQPGRTRLKFLAT